MLVAYVDNDPMARAYASAPRAGVERFLAGMEIVPL
jgi:hypothetical protein